MIVCDVCGDYFPVCQKCQKSCVIRGDMHEGPLDKRLTFDPTIYKRGWILEGERWDGSDLINCHGRNFVSKRVLDWLLMVHAAPFYAKPARFCTDGMTDKQLARLEEIQKPLDESGQYKYTRLEMRRSPRSGLPAPSP